MKITLSVFATRVSFAFCLSLVLWPGHAAAVPPPPLPVPSPSAAAPPTPSAPSAAPLGIIGRLERDRTTPPAKLQPYLDGPDAALSARAAIAIGRLRNPQGVKALISALQDGKRAETVRASAAFALGIIASPDAVPALAAAAREAPAIAGPAVDSLGRIGGDSAIDPLVDALFSRDPVVRGKAAIGLAEATFPSKPGLGGTRRGRATRALAVAFPGESDREARWRMAWAIARAYYTGNLNMLRPMLTDRDELVRLFGIRGMARLNDRSLALPVRLLARDRSWRVRIEVRNTLAKLKDRTVVDVKPPAVGKDDMTQPKVLPTSAPFGDHPQLAMVTNRGVIVLELFPDQAPYNVDNFLTLVDRGFYNGLAFFRVIADFVIQGGDPRNDGNGGPGYTVPAELNPLEQLTGVIALGLDYDQQRNVPLVDSGGSQFYVTQSPQLHLDEGFTTFGRVVKGMKVVWNIVEHAEADKAKGADFIIKAYRCEPVTPQTPEAERRLRTSESDYAAP